MRCNLPGSVYSRHLWVCVLVRSAAAAMYPRRLSLMHCRRSHHWSNQRTSRPRWVEAKSRRLQLKLLFTGKTGFGGAGERRKSQWPLRWKPQTALCIILLSLLYNNNNNVVVFICVSVVQIVLLYYCCREDFSNNSCLKMKLEMFIKTKINYLLILQIDRTRNISKITKI